MYYSIKIIFSKFKIQIIYKYFYFIIFFTFLNKLIDSKISLIIYFLYSI